MLCMGAYARVVEHVPVLGSPPITVPFVQVEGDRGRGVVCGGVSFLRGLRKRRGPVITGVEGCGALRHVDQFVAGFTCPTRSAEPNTPASALPAVQPAATPMRPRA